MNSENFEAAKDAATVATEAVFNSLGLMAKDTPMTPEVCATVLGALIMATVSFAVVTEAKPEGVKRAFARFLAEAQANMAGAVADFSGGFAIPRSTLLN